MRDFNTEVTQTCRKIFCDSCELKNLIEDEMCYKNPPKSACINLILTKTLGNFLMINFFFFCQNKFTQSTIN